VPDMVGISIPFYFHFREDVFRKPILHSLNRQLNFGQ
jgi:hypothetical protein